MFAVFAARSDSKSKKAMNEYSINEIPRNIQFNIRTPSINNNNNDYDPTETDEFYTFEAAQDYDNECCSSTVLSNGDIGLLKVEDLQNIRNQILFLRKAQYEALCYKVDDGDRAEIQMVINNLENQLEMVENALEHNNCAWLQKYSNSVMFFAVLVYVIGTFFATHFTS